PMFVQYEWASFLLLYIDMRTEWNRIHTIPCNDSVACADRSTCCKTLKGDWACCPLPEAVCCEDHLHCCPHGTVCNIKASTCDDSSGNAVTPMLGHVSVFPLPKVSNSRCDKSTTCPGKSTCCKTASGGWACCPLNLQLC
uniref:Granulin b n=1 Tax=Amphilophus citrinellus TaxID=61819 RepID=A0A3Q0RVT9_AMPCI